MFCVVVHHILEQILYIVIFFGVYFPELVVEELLIRFIQ